jgi:hypothetical protein
MGAVAERDVAELQPFFHFVDMSGIGAFLNRVFRFQYLVYTFHGCQAFRDVVACLREVFQGVDDAIQDDHVENKGRCING